jgi:hypothetical protein
MWPRLAAPRCPVCGQPGQACGPRTGEQQPGVTAATLLTTREGAAMAELREYNVTINGMKTTMRLSEKEAERLKAEPVDTAAREATAKARTAQNKARRGVTSDEE